MTKMKQATLFSLKSWKKVAMEDILKYKDILDKENEIEVIIRTLHYLKKKNPTIETVLTSGIDSSMKKLETHSSPRVSYEAKILIKHWNLDCSSKFQKTVPPEICNSECNIKTVEADEICKRSESVSVTKNQSATVIIKTQSRNELFLSKAYTKIEGNKIVCKTSPTAHLCKIQPDNQVGKMQSINKVYKTQTANQVCKQQSINESRKRDLTRRLQFAMQLFIEEVGKQEVKFYLEMQAV